MRGKERCTVENPGLYKRARHALALLTLGSLGVATAGCDTDSGAVAQMTTPSSFHAESTFSSSLVGPTPLVGLDELTFTSSLVGPTPLVGLECSGFVFSTSLNLIVAAGVQDLTMESVTLHMLDGTNLGGPSVTIPAPQLNAQFGSTFVRAGTNRVFALQPVFPCVGRRPHSLRATAFLRDRRGARETRTVTTVVR
jgi:hypothetical protein